MIESGSTDIELIKDALEVVSRDYVGVTGSCKMNVEGDRISSNFSLMGYIGGGEFDEIGFYNVEDQTVEFTRIHPKLPTR